MADRTAPPPLPDTPSPADRLRALGGAWGSDAIAEQLARLDLRYVALVPGSSYRGLHDSLVNYNGNGNPRLLLCLHEEHCVALAHGYAKVAERPMAAAVHANVGLLHAAMAVYNAFCDRAPLLLLGATGPLDAARRRPWIDWIHTAADQAALVRPFVKFDDQPHSVAAAVRSLARATALAAQVPRAPVYVCLDVSLQEDPLVDDTALAFPDTRRYRHVAPPGPAADDVRAVRCALAAARRPLFLLGRTNRSRAGWDARVALAERCGARVLTDLKLPAAFPTAHPLHAACPPAVFPLPRAGALIRAADVILSLDWVDLAGTLQAACPNTGGEPRAHVVHVSLDAALHNGWSKDHFGHPPVDHAVAADVDKFVAALLAAVVDDETAEMKSPEPWTWEEDDGAAANETTTTTNGNGVATPNGDALTTTNGDAETPAHGHAEPPDRIYMSHLADALYAVLDPDATSFLRLPLGWRGADLRATHPLAFLGQDGGAGVGSGPGMAVGAALALRDAAPHLLPVAVLGDGDFLMGASALWTAAAQRLPLLVVLANNASFFNDEVHQERVARARARDVANKGVGVRIDDPAPDLSAHAASLGARTIGGGAQVRSRAQLVEALRQTVALVRAEKTLVVLDVQVCPDGYSSALEKGK